MAFDKETRNALAKAVTACRRLLTADVTDQLRGTFGMHPDGTVLPLKDLRHLTEDQKEAAQALRDLLDHYAAAAAGTAAEKRKSAYERMVLEIAFTNLNRLAALRMCEERGLVLECVRKGPASDGFRMYEQLSGGALGTRFETYRLFLASLYDELAIDLGILFDRTTPQSTVFPTERCLEEVLAELNKAELAQLWKEDETIGWVYQYFNPPEERREMRDASQAPRNSRELAVRNQFFTPRYVVEFLTDNTLGRIWYEMRQGVTGLKEQCRYLVRRPDEVFLGHMTVPGPDGYEDEGTIAAAKLLLEGTEETFADFDASRDGDVQRMICMSHAVNGYARHEAGTWDGMEPLAAKMRAEELKDLSTQDILDYLFLTCRADRHGGMGEVYSERWFVAACNEVRRRVLASRNEDLPQQELLKQPVVIPYRAKKDPRDLKILDPACGSGHFLLYCFDLLLLIYVEAWEDGESPKSEATGRTMREDYATLAELCRAAPELILRWNLHGIDIDPRAVQIAAMALWLRAQRAWQEQHVKAADRPQVSKSSIVVAEPMPGEEDMRREFSESLHPRVLGQLVDALFDKMKLAGEAGSLLKIEDEIRDAVADAKSQWLKTPTSEQQFLFPELTKPQQLELRYDLAGVTDAAFWGHAEEQIIDALRAYAEHVRRGEGLRRHLFAEDTARGFAFVDLCRRQYDVALMNPPFGAVALPIRTYVAAHYATSKDDIYAAFVARFVPKLTNGLLGIISSRTGFFLTGMRRWRETTLLDSFGLRILADLGDGVLDDALVEAAAYVLGSTSAPCIFFRMLDQAEKAPPLLDAVHYLARRQSDRSVFAAHVSVFSVFPESRISYWASPSIRSIYRTMNGASGSRLEVKFGLSTKDDFRFLRLCWEIPLTTLVLSQEDATGSRPWMYIAKGGEYSLHFCDIHLVANWADTGREIGARVVQLYPYLNGDANWVLHTEVPYGRPGVTYTKRTTSGFSPRFLPAGCLISDMGCTVFADDDAKLPRVLATYASRAFGYMLEFNVASGDSVHSGSAARHYEIGTVASVPIPPISDVTDKVACDVIAMWRRKVVTDGREETGRFSVCPWLPGPRHLNLPECARAIRNSTLDACVAILTEASHAEKEIRRLYGFDAPGIEACDAEFGPDVTDYPEVLEDGARSLLARLWGASISELIADTSQQLGFSRFISKMTYLADRRLELLCHRFGAHPRAIVEILQPLPATTGEVADLARKILSYTVGCVLGRWDIRLSTGSKLAPEYGDPLAPLPICPPGMLQNDEGLAAAAKDVPADYPLRISWEGVLTEDSDHNGERSRLDDIVSRVREALSVLADDRAHMLEQEACDSLGVTSLREYFRKPTGFFQDHLKDYSKSRRKAPIYWPLSTASGSYTIWLYYHRLTDQTLYAVVNQFVEPKSEEVKRIIGRIERELADTTGREAARLRDQLTESRGLLAELEEMREELLRIAGLPYRPNLNDGVIINAAPLHKLFGHRAWAEDTADCWKRLEKGEYDWSHMAHTIWPDRVKKVCKKDLSVAIAHGLEDLYEGPKPGEKKERKPRGKKAKKEAAE